MILVRIRHRCALAQLCFGLASLAALNLAVVAYAAPSSPATTRDPKTQAYAKDVQPLLQKYCYDCHGNGEHKGDVALDDYATAADVLKGRTAWETVLHHVNSLEMPPSDAAAFPDRTERDRISEWIERTLYNYNPAHPDPGRVTVHRLNRNEYHNTIRDLTGVDFQPSYDFPADNSGFGFDNVSDVLSLSPTLLEDYLSAAGEILDQAIATDPIRSQTRRFPANLMQFGFNADGDKGDGWMPLSALEEDGLAMSLPVSGGEYMVRAQAYNKGRAGAAGAKPTLLTCMIDDAITHVWPITATTQDAPGVYEARMSIPPGKHRILVLNHRIRGGANELHMENGRIGQKQAGTIMVKWVELEGPLTNAITLYPAKKLEFAGTGAFNAHNQWVMEHNGEATTKFNVPKEGEYILRAEAYAQQAGTGPVKMEFRIDGQAVQSFEVLAPATRIPTEGQRIFSTLLLEAQPQMYEFHVKLAPGQKRFSTAFINEFADPKNEDPNLRKRALILDHLEVVGLAEPPALPEMPPPIKSLFAGVNINTQAKPDAAAKSARQVVTTFAGKAWRRPPASAEIDRMMTLYTSAQKDGLPFLASVKLPMKAVLVSPNFLFRGEIQPDPNNPESVHPIDEYALASRLSYFLWSSMPDQELTDLATHNKLRKQMDAQVRRMLASPKAQAFVENFAGQWLEIRNLQFVEPDKELYPDFDENLRHDMLKETELFFGSVLHEDRSILDFLNGDYTFVNNRLAKLYGMTNVTGDDFQRVSLAGTPRRGVFTQASVLTVTSNPTRTSPVKRGKWVLEELLGTPPPPPPPVVPALKNDGQPVGGTLRHQMEEHRANPTCASCHARMDPIGFGLENFDAIGAWREKEGDFAIDSSGKLVSGESFKGAPELSNILATTKRDFFVRCLTEKMLTYALGRGTEYYDRATIQKITSDLARNHYQFSTLILDVVNSLPFQMRRGEGEHLAAK
jgi:hypothetical protein